MGPIVYGFLVNYLNHFKGSTNTLHWNNSKKKSSRIRCRQLPSTFHSNWTRTTKPRKLVNFFDFVIKHVFATKILTNAKINVAPLNIALAYSMTYRLWLIVYESKPLTLLDMVLFEKLKFHPISAKKAYFGQNRFTGWQFYNGRYKLIFPISITLKMSL